AAVTETLDIRWVQIEPAAIALKPGESKKIEIKVERNPEYKGNVTLDAVYRHLGSVYGNSLPPGVTIDDKASQTLLTPDRSKGSLVLKAAGDAKITQEQQVAVMAHVSINFVVKSTYCAPLRVSVLPR